MLSVDMGVASLPMWNLMTDMVEVADDGEKTSSSIETRMYLTGRDLSARAQMPPHIIKAFDALTGKDGQEWNVKCSCQCMIDEPNREDVCRTHLRSSIDIVNAARVARGVYALKLYEGEEVNRFDDDASSSSWFSSSSRLNGSRERAPPSVADGSATNQPLIERLPMNEVVTLVDPSSGETYQFVRCGHSGVPSPSSNGGLWSETIESRQYQGAGSLHLQCRWCFHNTGILAEGAPSNAPPPYLGDSDVNVGHIGTLGDAARQLIMAIGSVLYCNRCRPHYALLSRAYVQSHVRTAMNRPTLSGSPAAVTYDTHEGSAVLALAPGTLPTHAALPPYTARFVYPTTAPNSTELSSFNSALINTQPTPLAIAPGKHTYMNDAFYSKWQQVIVPTEGIYARTIIDTRLANSAGLTTFIYRVRNIVTRSQAKRKDALFEKHPPHYPELMRQCVGKRGSVPHTWSVLIMLAFSQSVHRESELGADDYMSPSDEEGLARYIKHMRAEAAQWMAANNGALPANPTNADAFDHLLHTFILDEEDACGPNAWLAYEKMGAKRRGLKSLLEAITVLASASPQYRSIVSFIWPVPTFDEKSASGSLLQWLIRQEFEWARTFGNPEELLWRLRTNPLGIEFPGHKFVNAREAITLHDDYLKLAKKEAPTPRNKTPPPLPPYWMKAYTHATLTHFSGFIIKGNGGDE